MTTALGMLLRLRLLQVMLLSKIQHPNVFYWGLGGHGDVPYICLDMLKVRPRGGGAWALRCGVMTDAGVEAQGSRFIPPLCPMA